MPAPRVFISSTCYDLKYIRENLKYFIRSLGYEPILSEEGSVFYDPQVHVQDACLAEVPACQIFLLIIGGRYGGRYRDTDRSITNAEHRAAVDAKCPIFALVERGVFDQYSVYLSNKKNTSVDAQKISYPAVDSTRIFDFVAEVQGQAVNNALVPFSDFEEIQNYLKQQWAGMMYRFLTSESEARRTKESLASLESATQKIEFLTRELVQSLATPISKIVVELYDFLLAQDMVHDLSVWGLRASPKGILRNNTLDEFCDGQIEAEDQAKDEWGYTIRHGGPPYLMTKNRLEENRKQYVKIRKQLLNRLRDKKIPLEKFLTET